MMNMSWNCFYIVVFCESTFIGTSQTSLSKEPLHTYDPNKKVMKVMLGLIHVSLIVRDINKTKETHRRRRKNYDTFERICVNHM